MAASIPSLLWLGCPGMMTRGTEVRTDNIDKDLDLDVEFEYESDLKFDFELQFEFEFRLKSGFKFEFELKSTVVIRASTSSSISLSLSLLGGGGGWEPFKPFKPIKIPEHSTPCKAHCENACGYSNGMCCDYSAKGNCDMTEIDGKCYCGTD